MRVTILPEAIILIKARRAAVSMITKGVVWPEHCFGGVSYFYFPTMVMLKH